MSLSDLKAFIIGWTGACGEALSKELAKRNTFKQVVLIGRRKVEFPSDDPRSNFEQEVVNFDELDQSKDAFKVWVLTAFITEDEIYTCIVDIFTLL